MREIKFRAWDKLTQRMIYRVFNTRNDEDYILMQYTGLKDKNGKEIYEGDIIKQGDNPECWFAPRVVEFKHGAWMGGDIRIFVEHDSVEYQGTVSNNEWEILGNIHQHSHLLKEGECLK